MTAPLDLADPLADLGALYAAAQDAHNRGDEFATVCMRLVERLAEVPITHQHQIEHLGAEVERLRSIEASWAELAEGYIAQRNDLSAEVERLRSIIAFHAPTFCPRHDTDAPGAIDCYCDATSIAAEVMQAEAEASKSDD